jgi:hypothetical protein
MYKALLFLIMFWGLFALVGINNSLESIAASEATLASPVLLIGPQCEGNSSNR